VSWYWIRLFPLYPAYTTHCCAVSSSLASRSLLWFSVYDVAVAGMIPPAPRFYIRFPGDLSLPVLTELLPPLVLDVNLWR